jgi:CRISPR system Cascade subunit CasB
LAAETEVLELAYYWERYTAGDGSWKDGQEPPGEELAALRRGVGREAGDVPAMWRFYTELTQDGRKTMRLRAEHVALTLFAVHQQSKSRPMHRAGVGVGTAIVALRRDPRTSEEAVDRRFAAAATATSFTEVSAHLRGLITQIRRLDQGLDYTRLVKNLIAWQDPVRVPDIRRRWGAQYFTPLDPHPPPTNESAHPNAGQTTFQEAS